MFHPQCTGWQRKKLRSIVKGINTFYSTPRKEFNFQEESHIDSVTFPSYKNDVDSLIRNFFWSEVHFETLHMTNCSEAPPIIGCVEADLVIHLSIGKATLESDAVVPPFLK